VERIAGLAFPKNLTVLFIAVIESDRQEPAAHLRLVNLSSLLKAFSVDSETKLVSGGNWIGAVSEVWRAGDQIVCQAEQTVVDNEMKKVLLSNALSIALDVPVIVISGLYRIRESRQRTRLSELEWWGVTLIIVIALCGIMFYINQTMSGWVENVLLISTFLIAILIVWLWNKQR
jgi:K+-sensing histidine kinase KdpD